MSQGSKFHSLQLGRALAALAVVFLHCRKLWPGSEIDGSLPFYSYFGAAGVDVFFVLSGFIIALVAERQSSAGPFMRKRFARILPFYWAFTILYIGMKSVSKSVPSVRDVVWSLTALPQASLPALPVGWSLEHEFIFYGIVAIHLAMGLLRFLPVNLFLLSVASVIFHISDATRNLWDFHLLSMYHLQFLAGVMLYRYRSQIRTLPWHPLAAGAVVSALVSSYLVARACGYSHLPTSPEGALGLLRVLSFGITGFLILSALLAFEQQSSLFDIKSPLIRVSLSIGDASYALYLSHPIVIGVAVFVGARVSGIPPWALAFAAAAGSTALALCWYKFVEKPYLRWIDRPRAWSKVPAVDGAA